MFRRGGRAVEGARLESVYTLIAYRGFESRPLRHNTKGLLLSPFVLSGMGGFDSNPMVRQIVRIDDLERAATPRQRGKVQGCTAANRKLPRLESGDGRCVCCLR